MPSDPMTTPRDLRRQRLASGLCPACGKEAAPYYLCGDCRFRRQLGYFLKRATAAGGLEQIGQGRGARWRVLDKSKLDAMEFREAKDGDGRLRPRLGRIPVDLESTLLSLLRDMGRPATIEEIYVAWGRLREKRKTASLAGDMQAIIEAQRRRKERNARRAARHVGSIQHV